MQLYFKTKFKIGDIVKFKKISDDADPDDHKEQGSARDGHTLYSVIVEIEVITDGESQRVLYNLSHDGNVDEKHLVKVGYDKNYKETI